MGKKRKSSVTAKYVLLFSSLLLLTNIILGVVMYNQSKGTVRDLVRKNMLSISSTAAGLMDGDTLASFTEVDVDSPEWNEIKKELSVFKNNTDIEYIYTVRQEGENKYVFVVDPDPVNPGELGEEVLKTAALINAGKGIAGVDTEAAEDEWGNFYSSYSPVFGSDGEVAAIVGVDFDALWYEQQVREHMMPAVFIIIIFMAVGILIVVFFSQKMLGRLHMLNNRLSDLTVGVEDLIQELSLEVHVLDDSWQRAVETVKPEDDGTGDEIEILNNRLQEMQNELKHYRSFAHARACTDALTGVRNTTAYTEEQESLETKIEEGAAQFCVILFDINDLKKVNDNYGHVTGDEIIRGAANSIASVFGYADTFRIGGDEFLAIAEEMSEEAVREKLVKLDETIAAYNVGRNNAVLSISVGVAAFSKETDTSFREVFIRADESMYIEKQAFHQKADR